MLPMILLRSTLGTWAVGAVRALTRRERRTTISARSGSFSEIRGTFPCWRFSASRRVRMGQRSDDGAGCGCCCCCWSLLVSVWWWWCWSKAKDSAIGALIIVAIISSAKSPLPASFWSLSSSPSARRTRGAPSIRTPAKTCRCVYEGGAMLISGFVLHSTNDWKVLRRLPSSPASPPAPPLGCVVQLSSSERWQLPVRWKDRYGSKASMIGLISGRDGCRARTSLSCSSRVRAVMFSTV